MLHNFIFIFIKELFIKKGQLFTKLKKIMNFIQFSTTQRLAKCILFYKLWQEIEEPMAVQYFNAYLLHINVINSHSEVVDF